MLVNGNALRLHLGDCLQILPTLDADSVDLVVTSPPYNLGIAYEGYDDNLSDDVFKKFIGEMLTQVFRVMSNSSRFYLIVSDRMIYWAKPLAERIGFIYSQLMPWCKPNFSGGAGRISGDWNMLTEYIMLFRKGKRTPMLNANVNTHNFFVIPSPQRNFKKDKKLHIAQYPLKLIKTLIARTPGDTVLDPFMGSCTTGIACLEMGRNFIGIEIVPEYYAIAEQRIADAQRQIVMDI